jgi:hypothetical protein
MKEYAISREKPRGVIACSAPPLPKIQQQKSITWRKPDPAKSIFYWCMGYQKFPYFSMIPPQSRRLHTPKIHQKTHLEGCQVVFHGSSVTALLVCLLQQLDTGHSNDQNLWIVLGGVT